MNKLEKKICKWYIHNQLKEKPIKNFLILLILKYRCRIIDNNVIVECTFRCFNPLTLVYILLATLLFCFIEIYNEGVKSLFNGKHFEGYFTWVNIKTIPESKYKHLID